MQSAVPVMNGEPQPAKQPPPQMNGDTMPPAVDEKKESPSADGYLQQEGPMHPVHPAMMNGGMPPQQVFVNSAMVHPHHGMVGLETQFQGFGIQDGGHESGYHQSDGDEDAEEGNGEETPVKLFVGQVRYSDMLRCHFL